MKLFTKSKDICTCNQHMDYQSCCDIFKEFLNDCKVGLKYDKKDRRFSICAPRKGMSHGISHCPWCGYKLPSLLDDKREEVLLEEFGIKNPYKDEIPDEFKTDEWWKKRGL